MEKTCPKCKKTFSPALRACPRCGSVVQQAQTVLSASGGRPFPVSQKSDAPGGRRRLFPIIIIAGLVITLSAAAFFFHRSGGVQTVKRFSQKIQGKEWKYPPGDEAATARAMTVQQLIDAWETIPGRSQTLLHATYAKALGLKGKEAVIAIPVLAPHVTDKDLYLRQGAMAGLAGIGEEGLPHLVKALKYPDSRSGDAATVRWDAAMAIATMGVKARGAMQDLLDTVMDPKENPNVKGDAAAALAGIGNEAVPALNRARCHFYDQGGLPPSEVSVLREINLALQRMNADTEDCKGLASQQSEGSSSAPTSSSMFLSAAELNKMQVPQLLEALRSHPYNTQMIADELAKKGAKAQAAEVLTSMLKGGSQTSDLGIKMALGKLGAPVTYDRTKNVFLPIAEDNIGYIEWSGEMRGDAVYSTGKIYIGREVIDGLSREQSGPMKVPTFVRYTITVKGGTLGSPVEKTFDVNTAGEHDWEDVMLASGLGKGKYSITLFLHAQFAKEDGKGQILNNNAGFLEVER